VEEKPALLTAKRERKVPEKLPRRQQRPIMTPKHQRRSIMMTTMTTTTTMTTRITTTKLNITKKPKLIIPKERRLIMPRENTLRAMLLMLKRVMLLTPNMLLTQNMLMNIMMLMLTTKTNTRKPIKKLQKLLTQRKSRELTLLNKQLRMLKRFLKRSDKIELVCIINN